MSTTRTPGRYWLDVALNTQDPHSMTGAAVTGLLAILVDHEEAEGKAESDTAAYDELDAAYRDLEGLHDAKQAKIEEALTAMKKSSSKLADQLRSILEPVVAPPSASAPVVEHAAADPGDGASLEEWREYARGRGLQGADVDAANRSQIRTMLGLPHQPAVKPAE